MKPGCFPLGNDTSHTFLKFLSFRNGVKPLRNLLSSAAERAGQKQIPPFGRNHKSAKAAIYDYETLDCGSLTAYLIRHQSARTPSFQPIFLPSA